ncbi:MAG: HEAT repeat domain-containing protein [Planctomycetes bacterium]|nr:HEAT repeat domain-containing protein [Planctomycetota bacterium]
MHSHRSRLPLLFAGAGLAAAAAFVVTCCWSGGLAVPLPAVVDAPALATPAADLVARGTGDQRSDAQGLHGALGAPAGSTFRYRLVDRSDFTFVSPEAGTHPGGRLHLECEVTTTVLDRRGDETLLREQFAALRFFGSDGREVAGDPVQQQLAAAAVAPVLVRLEATGKVLGYGFADGLDGDQRNFLRGVLGVLHFPAPIDGVAVWSITDSDTTGDYTARCELLPSADAEQRHVRRTRERYQHVAGHDEPPLHELRGRGEAVFSLRQGWIVSTSLDEGMSLQLPLLDLRVDSQRKADAVLVEAGHVRLEPAPAADWERATAPATGAGERIGGFAATNQREAWRQRLAGVTLDQLLRELQDLLAQADTDREVLDGAFQRLQWFVRLDETAAAEIGQRIVLRELHGDAAGVALSSLGAAGTDAAQAVLVQVRADRSLAAEVRQAATISALQLETPSPALVDGLLRDAQEPVEASGSAMLVLGALAPRQGAPLADGRSALESLLALEPAAAARGELATWLLAVGNAAPPQTVAIVRRHVDHSDPAVRAAACVALRRIADPIVVGLLVEHGLADAAADVRLEALLVLGRRREPAARAALQQIAQTDPDEQLRRRAQDLLQNG